LNLLLGTFVFISAMAVPTLASAQSGNPAEGRRLAERWCASCHEVEPNALAQDVPPSFASLGVQRNQDPGWVRAWLANPHPPMRGIELSRQQIDDIVAYLQSLAAVR
jgi:mono/diheme cytochrome c family protein